MQRGGTARIRPRGYSSASHTRCGCHVGALERALGLARFFFILRERALFFSGLEWSTYPVRSWIGSDRKSSGHHVNIIMYKLKWPGHPTACRIKTGMRAARADTPAPGARASFCSCCELPRAVAIFQDVGFPELEPLTQPVQWRGARRRCGQPAPLPACAIRVRFLMLYNPVLW